MNALSKLLQALPAKHENVTYSNFTWQVYKYDNGKFFMTGKNTGEGSTGTMTKYPTTSSVSAALGIGPSFTINFPSIGQKTIEFAEINTISNAGYAIFNPIYNLSTDSITSTYVRFGTNASVSGLTVEIFVIGTWGKNQ